MLAANEAADHARTRALDPALSVREVAEARRQMEYSAFARDRLTAALPRLKDRLKELLAAEEDARRWVAYNKAKAERDKLVEELSRTYPAVVDQLVDLLTRLAANDRTLEVCNRHSRPQRAEHLRTAEEVARGLFKFEKERNKQNRGGSHPPLPRLTTDLKLPKFAAAHGHMFAWPPRSTGPLLAG